MTIRDHFVALVERINQRPHGISGLNAVFQFDISGAEQRTYQIKFMDGTAKFLEGEAEKADSILQLSDENLKKLVKGELNPTMAYMTGKLKIKGDLSLTMRLPSILKQYQ
jgi:putative sterol carrier protein